MKNASSYIQSAIVSGLIAILLITQTAFTQTAAAQQPAAAQPPAPVQRNSPEAALTPEAQAQSRLLSAHTIYLAQSTQDAHFPTSPTDAYNLVLNNLKNWGRYQIVDSVAQADLVLQLRDAVRTSVVDDTNDSGSTVYYIPSFQITIADPSTLSPIWTVSSSVPTAFKQKNETRLLAASATNVVSQLKLLTGDQLTAQDQSAQKQINHFYRARTGLIVGLTAAGVATTLGLFFLFRHNAQQNAAQFCQEHGISPCPGA